MQRQARRDTGPEVALRRVLHARGLRYRLDVRPVPTVRRRADLVFRRARVAVFVDGCYWHRCPLHGTQPKANTHWWREKLDRNARRDRDTDVRLAAAGWTVMRVWEHEDPEVAAERVAAVVRGRVGIVLGMAEIVVREVRTEEFEALGRLTVEAYLTVFPAEEMGDYAAELADVADRAATAVVLVAVGSEGDLLGGVTYVPGLGPYAEFEDADAAGIRMLAVAPNARGRGAGLALIRACLERARADARARVVLHSTNGMEAAQRLYVREGFRRAPERDWEPEPGLRLSGYTLELS